MLKNKTCKKTYAVRAACIQYAILSLKNISCGIFNISLVN